ncbi:ABC transporter substrate-binding protein [Falsiroseomonas bella]|uniref:ABC transporter substrate-binding protein n=1 Tax=Falsiroseomonas bella TaxID=2184016 RepID=A0A317FKC6_9PROT|nr:tripartite tricarboxylate transporter substrate binding protein [Falsiroseomonas bella]PWS38056.1 ABC transporter substrate-binding protein [Falsiroseomonas bella]
MRTRLSRRTLGILGLSLSLAPALHAQEAYPTRPVRMVVPFAAGGSTDILARLIAQHLSNRLEQQFIVENKPGGGTNIAAEYVVKSRPDGYTLLFGAAAMATNPSLLPSMPYDLFKDLEPIAVIGRTPLVLVVHPSVPARNVQDLLALARSRPEGLNAATGGNGTIPHLATELLRFESGVKLTHIPYRGQATAMPDVLSGRVPMMLESIPPLLPVIRNGELRALAAAEPERLAALPDVPTLIESGFPNLSAAAWNAMFAPAGTPAPILAKLNAEVNAIMRQPDVQARFAELGARPVGGTPEDMRRFLRAEVDRWAEVVRRSGAKAD